MKRLWITLGMIAAAAVYIFMQVQIGNAAKNTSVSANTGRGKGMSQLYRSIQGLENKSAKLLRQAILKNEDLPPNVTLIIASPLRQISELEVNVIEKFVADGGALLLSFHDQSGFYRIRGLISKLGIDLNLKKNEGYRNRKTEKIRPPRDTPFVTKRERYEFYSPFLLDHAECERQRFSCFYLEEAYLQGVVIVQAGLPIFSNSLLQRSNNLDFTARLIASSGEIWFDEYRHFFSDKSVIDLILTPSLSLPLLGLLMILFLYFFLGHHPELEAQAHGIQNPPPLTFHSLNANVIASQLSSNYASIESLEMHKASLMRKFPEFRAEIESIPTTSSTRTQGYDVAKMRSKFVSAHRSILKRKGRG